MWAVTFPNVAPTCTIQLAWSVLSKQEKGLPRSFQDCAISENPGKVQLFMKYDVSHYFSHDLESSKWPN